MVCEMRGNEYDGAGSRLTWEYGALLPVRVRSGVTAVRPGLSGGYGIPDPEKGQKKSICENIQCM